MTDAGFDLAAHVRDIPDFPKEGILFRDIMPLLQEPKALHEAVDRLVEYGVGKHVDVVMGAEARGFILGAAVAYGLGAGFVCARKPGKLPHDTISAEYDLEYGTDKLEVHADAIKPGQNVLVHDDLLATGGHGQGQDRARREARRQGRRRRLHHRARRPRGPQEARGLRRLQPDHVLTAQGGLRFAGPPHSPRLAARPGRRRRGRASRHEHVFVCGARSLFASHSSRSVGFPKTLGDHLHAIAALRSFVVRLSTWQTAPRLRARTARRCRRRPDERRGAGSRAARAVAARRTQVTAMLRATTRFRRRRAGIRRAAERSPACTAPAESRTDATACRSTARGGSDGSTWTTGGRDGASRSARQTASFT